MSHLAHNTAHSAVICCLYLVYFCLVDQFTVVENKTIRDSHIISLVRVQKGLLNSKWLAIFYRFFFAQQEYKQLKFWNINGMNAQNVKRYKNLPQVSDLYQFMFFFAGFEFIFFYSKALHSI